MDKKFSVEVRSCDAIGIQSNAHGDNEKKAWNFSKRMGDHKTITPGKKQ